MSIMIKRLYNEEGVHVKTIAPCGDGDEGCFDIAVPETGEVLFCGTAAEVLAEIMDEEL